MQQGLEIDHHPSRIQVPAKNQRYYLYHLSSVTLASKWCYMMQCYLLPKTIYSASPIIIQVTFIRWILSSVAAIWCLKISLLFVRGRFWFGKIYMAQTVWGKIHQIVCFHWILRKEFVRCSLHTCRWTIIFSTRYMWFIGKFNYSDCVERTHFFKAFIHSCGLKFLKELRRHLFVNRLCISCLPHL